MGVATMRGQLGGLMNNEKPSLAKMTMDKGSLKNKSKSREKPRVCVCICVCVCGVGTQHRCAAW